MPEELDEPLLLVECWQYWVERCAALTAEEWVTPTRCPPWTVAALVAHVAPDPAVLAQLPGAVLGGEAAVSDPAALLRGFNEQGGAAIAMAAAVADMAVRTADELGSKGLIQRFVESGQLVLGDAELPATSVVPHPVVGSVTVGVLTGIAIVEATVHYLDLLDAVGGQQLPDVALEYARDVLVRVSPPAPFIEAITGRRNPLTWFPLIR